MPLSLPRRRPVSGLMRLTLNLLAGTLDGFSGFVEHSIAGNFGLRRVERDLHAVLRIVPHRQGSLPPQHSDNNRDGYQQTQEEPHATGAALDVNAFFDHDGTSGLKG